MTEYSQQDTMAHVDGTISIASCPAGSTGKFKIVARVRDESGDTKLLEFDQAWQRDDTEDHKFSSDFMIGENSELMSVRLRSLDCSCAATAATPTTTAATPAPTPEIAAAETPPPN